jgi:hypothetical protein
VWNILAWPGPEAPVNAALFAVANGLLLLNLMTLFVGARRPLHDRLAGTVMQAIPAARLNGGTAPTTGDRRSSG